MLHLERLRTHNVVVCAVRGQRDLDAGNVVGNLQAVGRLSLRLQTYSTSQGTVKGLDMGLCP